MEDVEYYNQSIVLCCTCLRDVQIGYISISCVGLKKRRKDGGVLPGIQGLCSLRDKNAF